MYVNKTIKSFLEDTSSKHPLVPSGGSVLALCAALSAALAELVANTTIDKKGYERVQDLMIKLSKMAEDYRNIFVREIDNDANVYSQVVQAYKMSKSKENEKLLRETTIDENLKKAALVPLELAQNTLELLEIIKVLMKNGNKNAIGDAKAAYIISKAVVEASINNVEINCSLIKDKDFVDETLRRVREVESRLNDNRSVFSNTKSS
ncbi:cyclodeaminase/cyclohydrolase family protein [Wukongibacter baidiensis]|uniref:cyclodeaminase/cyclohydrolase family protein n=1 Tax=Wukongibacter baidiensis TaxID=1723361 RepID=UPI003D7FFBA2